MPISNCCTHSHTHKVTKCRRKSDGKIFSLPRRFTRKKCKKGIRGFSARSSCAPYKDCINKQKGGAKTHSAVAVIDMNNIKGTVRFKSKNDDQKRIMSPKEAYKQGSDWLVIGRELTNGDIKNNFRKLSDHLYK